MRYNGQMRLISLFLPYIQVALAVLLSVGILVQRTAAGLGGALGDNFSSGFHTRRGFEKFTFNATIVLAIAFAISAFLALIIK
jgi:preprotein translocase subunit SecG